MSLHTSFLRVIRHHDALSRLHSRLPLKLTGLQTHCRPHASSGDDTQLVSQPETQPEEIDLIHHQNRSSHKVWRLWPWLLLQPTAVHQVNLPFSYYRSKGTTPLPRRRRGTRHARDTLRSLAKLEEAQVMPFHTHTPTSSHPTME